MTSASLIIPGTGPALSTSQSVVIISNDGADPVTGTFAGLPQGGTVTAADGRTFTVSYTAGDGNDVALIGTTPTPPTAVLMTPPPMVDMLNNSATTTFTVRYTDDAAVDGSTLGADIDVIAPDGTTVVGTATANPAANGTPLAAVYTLTRTRPWLPTERGKFTLKLRANEVRDTAGTAAAATTLGTFEVCVRDRLPAEFLASGATAPAATQTAFLVLRSSVSRRLTDVRGESLSPANRSFTPDADGKYGAGSVVDFGNQAHVAVGDVNGDGTPDRVLGSAFGSSSVRIISGTDNTLLADFQALGLINGDHLFGVYVAVGDLDGDGKADVAVTGDALDALNGPQANGLQVRVFSGASMTNGTTSPTVLADFNGLASLDGQQGEGPNVRLGGRVAIGDVNGDGRPDLLVAAGNGGGPRITIWDGAAFPGAAANGRKPTKNPIANLFVFEQGQRGGAFVAAGDVNGDCFLDIIAGGGPGGGPRVRIVNGKMLFDPILKLFQANVNLDDPANLTNGLVLSNFFAFNVNDRGGVRVAAKDSDGDTRADVIVGAGYPSTANGERTLFQSTFFLDPILRPSVPRTVKVYLGSALAQTTGEPNFQEFNPFGDASVVDGVFVG